MKLNLKKKNTPESNKVVATKRNSNYDWFQGKGEKGRGPQTPRQILHKYWKIVRIFLYISLAALSLTGCVQSFVVKTTNFTGTGMEIYANKDDIAPHITTVSWDKKQKLMTMNIQSNYWLNPKNKTDNEALKDIREQIKKGSGDMATWKTENQAIQFVEVDGSKAIKTEVVDYKKDVNGLKQYLALGESQKNYSKIYAAKEIMIPLLLFDESTHTITRQNIPYKLTQIDSTKSENNIFRFADDVLQRYWSFVETSFDVLTQNLKNESLNSTVKGDHAKKYVGKKEYEAAVLKLGLDYRKYFDNLQRLQSYTGLLISPQKIKGQPTYTAVMTSNGNIGFHLAAGSKLRAIYDWKTSWKLGPFYGMFIYPLSKLTLGIVNGMPMLNGWESVIAIFLAVIIIRTFAYMLTFKSTLQQVKQQELSAKRAAIEAKYMQYKGNKQMEQRKRQEMSEMFKKEGISPLGAIGTMFLTMPIFLAMWKIIGGIPHFKSTHWLGISFASTSYKELFTGKWQYLPLMLVAGAVQGISLFIPRLLTKRRDKKRIDAHQKEALKKANKTQNIMMVVFIVMAFIFSAGIQIYWIFGGIFTIGQNVLNHFIIKKQSMRKKQNRVK